MGKIYVITAGSYSDYHICGATTDYDRAVDMVSKLRRLGGYVTKDAEIEAFDDGVFAGNYGPLDKIEPADYWEVELRTGTKEATIRRYSAPKGQVVYVSCREGKGPWEEFNGYPRREKFTIYTVNSITAPDKEHAFKIACDEIAKYRANEEKLV